MFRKTMLAALIVVSYASSAIAGEQLKVVASFSILADMTKRVGGDQVDVTSLVGPNKDMHGFEPTPADAKTLTSADVIVINGLGFEGWQKKLMSASGFNGTLIAASEAVKPLELAEADQDHDHEHGTEDPHAWQDLSNGKLYAEAIAAGLCAAQAEACDTFKGNAQAYIKEMDALDRSIKASLGAFPPEDRVIITSHDAFGYFGKAYGVTLLAPEGVGNKGNVSAKKLATLIRQIKSSGAKALFVENISNPKLLNQIARETGLKSGGTLYSDSLSAAEGPASTYLDMMEHNAETIAKAIHEGRS